MENLIGDEIAADPRRPRRRHPPARSTARPKPGRAARWATSTGSALQKRAENEALFAVGAVWTSPYGWAI